MPRTTKMDHFLRTLAPQKPKQFSIKQINEMLRRRFRRDMKARGLLSDEQPKFVWAYPVGLGNRDTVVAATRSEARGLIKKKLGIAKSSRLPPGFEIEKVEDAA